MASVLNRFGDSLDVVAMSWLIYQISGSAAFSALNFCVNYLPSVLLQPFCGVIVEKKDHKMVVSICDVLRAIVTFSIALAALRTGGSAWMVLLCTFLISTLEAFRQPAGTAFIPDFLAEKDIESAVALNQTISNAVVLIGTACAGIMIAAIGAPAAIMVDACCIFGSAVMTFLIRAEKKSPAADEAAEEGIWEGLKSGIHFILDSPALRIIAITGMLTNMLGVPYMSLQAAIVKELFHQGPAFVSLMNTFYMIGMILGSVLAPSLRKKVKNSHLFLLAIFMTGAGYCLFVLTSHFSVGIGMISFIVSILLLGIGFAVGILNVMLSVLLMEKTQKDYLARISAVVSSVLMTGQLSSSAIISILLTRMSLAVLFIFISCAAFVICFVLGLNPAMKQMDEDREQD